MKLISVVKKMATQNGRTELRAGFIRRTGLLFAKNLKGYIPFSPSFIGIEPTSRCNLRCKICARSYWMPDTKIGDMTMETFNKILPYLSRRVIVSPQMFGEPLFAPHFFDMLHIIKKRGCFVVINTNGTLFTPENCEKLVKEQTDAIGISIDGIETLEEIRGVEIDTITRNIENLNQAKRRMRSSKPHLAIAFVGMYKNIKELPKMIEFAKAHGINGIEVVHLTIHSENLLNEALFSHKEVAIHYFEISKIEAKKRGVRILLPTFEEKNYRCTHPFFSLWINWNGDVRPCCRVTLDTKDSLIMGNINQYSLRKLWNSKEMRNLRLELSGLLPLNLYCRECPKRYLSLKTLTKFKSYSKNEC